MSETVLYILIACAFGFVGGLITIPINMMVSSLLKRDELKFRRELDIIAKKRELLLQHILQKDKNIGGF